MPRASSPLIIVAALVIIGLILAALNASDTANNPNLISPTPAQVIPSESPVLPSPPISLSPSVTGRPDTSADPAAAVSGFYSWYLSQTPPIAADGYQTSPYLSAAFKRRISTMTSTGAVSALICGADNPLSFRASTISDSASRATVEVTQDFGTYTRTIPVTLVKDTGMWQLDTIICPKTSTTPSLSPTTTNSPSPSPAI